MKFIREQGDFSTGVAGFPEGHIACRGGKLEDWRHLQEKVEEGADFVVTQLFFDNADFFEFRDHVAGKLGVTPFDLSDPVVMTDVRNEFGFGRIHSYAISQPAQANQIEAKLNISRVLDVPINCVQRFARHAGLAARAGAQPSPTGGAG